MCIRDSTRRIVFHEITKGAILKAIENPRDIDINLVDADVYKRQHYTSRIMFQKIYPCHDVESYFLEPTGQLNKMPTINTVSYTHLDVYKRQRLCY